MLNRATICTLSLIILCFGISTLHAQKENDLWYFGYNAGLDFTAGSPTVMTNGQILTQEGTSTVSDPNGNLLFYTDGVKVFDRNHQPMPNGYGLMGNLSTTQSALSIQNPANPLQYFLFTNDYQHHGNGMRYSIVDMGQNNGKGDVITKNSPLHAPTTEKQAATRMANGLGTWVVGHGWKTNAFYAYPVTSSGVGTAVVSHAGITIEGSTGNVIGCIKFSGCGCKLAVATRDSMLQLFDFNNVTGQVSNPISIIPPNVNYLYGVEFSPDNTKLYVSTLSSGAIYQYDLAVYDSASIAGSEQLIGLSNSYSAGNLQLAPDGKIYMARFLDNWLAAIDQPDIKGPGCNFIDMAVNLQSGTSVLGLPSMLRSTQQIPNISVSSNCLNDSTEFYMNYSGLFDSIKWFFDDPGSGPANTSIQNPAKHLYTQVGYYHIIAVRYCSNSTDTLRQLIYINEAPIINLGSDTTICRQDTLLLHADYPFSSYLWQNNDTLPYQAVTDTGNFWVTVTNGCGSSRDSIRIDHHLALTAYIGPDTTICIGDTIRLSPQTNAASWTWEDNTTAQTHSASNPGIYWLEAYNICEAVRDSMTLSNIPVISIDLGNDTSICPGDSLLLDAFHPGCRYSWQNGDTLPQVWADSGRYTVIVSNQCGWVSDSLDITPIKPLDVNLGADTVLCPGTILPLNASNPAATYQWQDGSTPPQYQVSTPGIYSVVVTNTCETVSDQLAVSYFKYPSHPLPADTLLCKGDSLYMDLNFTQANYLWDNGSTDSTRTLSQAGTYWVEIQHSCGVARDSITISTLNQPPPLNLGPDTAVCPGSTLLLDASYPGMHYLWQDGSQNPIYQVSWADTFWVQLSNACGMTTDSIVIDVLQIPTLDIGNDTAICEGDSVIFTANVNGLAYLWQNGATTASVTVNQPCWVWCQMQHSCAVLKDSALITQLQEPYVAIGNDTGICPGKNIKLNAQVQYSNNVWWSGGTAGPENVISEPGLYTISAANQCGTDTDSIIIDIYALPDPPTLRDTFLCMGETIELNINWRNGLYLWSDGSFNTSLKISKPGRYWLEVTDQHNCKQRDSLLIWNACQPACDIPTAFTPNGDGLNDFFNIRCQDVANYSIQLYNRWGQLIYNSENLADSWDGTFGGDEQPIGSYMYIINAFAPGSRELKYYTGSVTLLR